YIDGEKNILPDRAKLMFYQTITSDEPLGSSFFQQYRINEVMPFYTISSKFWDDPRVQAYLTEPNRSYLFEASRDSLNVEVTGHIGRNDMEKLKMKPLFNKWNVNITEEQANKIKNISTVKSVKIFDYPDGDLDLFPNNEVPVYMPKKGTTVSIYPET